MYQSYEPKKKTVFVGLSGGVDSAVAALTLKQQGFQVKAIFMQNWEADYEDPYCTATQDLTDAKCVCDHLNIPLETVNFSKDYWHRVFQHCLGEFSQGRTPNPDIFCNSEIKFKSFLGYAMSKGADFIATGHYVQSIYDKPSYCLLKAKDPRKDQSYFLHRLNQYQIQSSLFPLGVLQKSQVRLMAKQAGLPNHAKRDSTGLCFIGERPFKKFLQEYLLNQPGPIKTEDGKHLAQHDGLMFYTLGQRKGLGLGSVAKKSDQLPWYVLKKDLKNNTLIVGSGHHHPALLSDTLTCNQLHWISGSPPTFPLRCQAKIRYLHKESPCTVTDIDSSTNTKEKNMNQSGSHLVTFDQKQWAITPGQAIVFYQNNHCLGGGIIQET